MSNQCATIRWFFTPQFYHVRAAGHQVDVGHLEVGLGEQVRPQVGGMSTGYSGTRAGSRAREKIDARMRFPNSRYTRATMLLTDGFPQAVLDRYTLPLKRLKSAIDCARSCNKPGRREGTRAQLLAAGILAHCTTTAEAVYNLFCMGYENAAATLVRSMAEVAIDCAFIWKKDTDDRVDAYYRHAVVSIVQAAESLCVGEQERLAFLAQHAPGIPAHLKSFQQIRAWVKAEFGNKREWTTTALPDRASQADIGPLYSMIYRIGCSETHSNVAALPFQAHDTGALHLVIGAHVPESSAWAVGANGALLITLGAVGDVVGDQADVERIKALGDEWTTNPPMADK